MCDPATIAATTTAISAAASGAGQLLAYGAQNRAAVQNANAAVASYQDQLTAQNAKAVQVDQAASEDVVSNAIAEQRAKSAAVTRGAAQGLGDLSIADLVQGVDFQVGRQSAIDSANRNAEQQQISRENRGLFSQAQGRINAVPTASRSALIAGLVGTAANAGTSLYSSGVLDKAKPTAGVKPLIIKSLR